MSYLVPVVWVCARCNVRCGAELPPEHIRYGADALPDRWSLGTTSEPYCDTCTKIRSIPQPERIVQN